MAKKQTPHTAFDNKEYLHSHEGRVIRVMAEFLEPKHRFNRYGIEDTIVLFGSARSCSMTEAKKRIKVIKDKKRVTQKDLKRIELLKKMSGYYEDAVQLSKKLAQWTKKHTDTFGICSGGGPGMMEAANKGAKLGGCPSIGLNINLPFEQSPNPYITDQLNFEFHYFFLRKFWFLYHAKAIIVFPGGFGTLDEMMEVLTLVQTNKVQKDMAIVLYDDNYWKNVINFEFLAEMNAIEEKDLKLFKFCSNVDDAYYYVVDKLNRLLKKRQKKDQRKYRRLIVES